MHEQKKKCEKEVATIKTTEVLELKNMISK